MDNHLNIKNYDEIEGLIRQGNKVYAIKMVRESTGMNLKDATMLVDKIQKEVAKLPKEKVVSRSVAETRSVSKCPECGSSSVQPTIKKILGIFKTSKMECTNCGKVY